MYSHIIVSLLSLGLGLVLGFIRHISFQGSLIIIYMIGYSIKCLYDTIPSSYINMAKFGLKMSGFSIFDIFKYIKNLKEEQSSKISKQVEIKDGRLHIDYTFKGEKKRHTVPYNHSRRIAEKKYKVELITQENEFIDITQHPGTMYKHSATDYGCDSIKVINKLTGKETFFLGEDIPQLN